MKKIVSILLVTILLIGGLFTLTGCGSKEKESKIDTEVLTYNEAKRYKVSVTVPKDKGYAFEGFKLVGEKFTIEFKATSYVYQTSIAWKDKYGETEGNFEDFKKATEQRINGMTGIVTQVNGEDVVEKTWNNTVIRYYNGDGIVFDGGGQFSATLKPTDESTDAETLLEDEEVKAIFDSIKLEKK